MTLTFRRHSVKIFLASAFLIVGLITFVPKWFDSSSNEGSSRKKTITDSSSRPENPVFSDIASTSHFSSPSRPGGIDRVLQSRVASRYGKLPLSFEANHGQAEDEVKFISRGSGYRLLLTSTDAVLRMRTSAPANKLTGVTSDTLTAKTSDIHSTEAELRMKLVGANPKPEITGIDKQAGESNYFIGNDPAKWRTNVPHYARVQYKDVYRGVDLVFHGNQGQLEYDFVVAAGANPDVIEWGFDGVSEMQLDTDGGLVLSMPDGKVRQDKPVIYQEINGERKEIGGNFVIKGNRAVGFEVAEYDSKRPLVIDPVLSYSTYLGGAAGDVGYEIAVDSSGNAYVTGSTKSVNFPVANSLPFGDREGGSEDVFVTKLNAAGSALVYSTYLGGHSSRDDRGLAIAVDSSGNAYVTGYTVSTDFPTVNALQPALRDFRDAFVAKLNPTGSALLYSTYLGGSDSNEETRGIAVDSAGNAYVTGYTRSTDFPTANALHPAHGGGSEDAFITKLNPAGSALVYSTYLGGHSFDFGNSVAVDSSGSAYVTGLTYSSNFPLANPLQSTCGCSLGNCGGNGDVFITKVNPTGSALVYSTYLGGNSVEEGQDIALDSSGNAYITGQTGSTDFPTVNPLQATYSGSSAFCNQADTFVAKLNAVGSALVYSTYLGGYNSDGGHGIAVDSEGNAYVTGYTSGGRFGAGIPTANAPQPTFGGGGGDAFVTKLNPAGSALSYYTYLGGSTDDVGKDIAVDSVGNAYVTGDTHGNFPTKNPFQPVFGGGNFNTNENLDAFVAKIGDTPLPQAGLSISAVTPNRGGNTGSVSVTIHGSGFKSGATVKLVRAGQPDIIAPLTGISEDGTLARARFILTGRTAGVRDIVVANPDSTSTTLAQGFTVEEGGRSQMWVDIIGRDEYRPGRPQTYYIAYGNRGNIDAVLLPIILAMPKDAEYELGFDLMPPPKMHSGEDLDFSEIPIHITTEAWKILPLTVPFVPAGKTGLLKIRITAQGDGVMELVARTSVSYDPIPSGVSSHMTTSPNQTKGLTCLAALDYQPGPFDVDSRIVECVGSASNVIIERAIGFVPGAECVKQMKDFAYNSLSQSITQGIDIANETFDAYDGVSSGVQTVASLVPAGAKCLGKEVPGPAQIYDAIQLGLGIFDVASDCFPVIGEVFKRVRAFFSIDPNDKAGPTGVGQERHLSGEEPLRYSIYFENVEAATAPAQDVVITDQLDPAKLDFDTFSLGPIGFGKDTQVVPPPGLSEFKKDVDLRPGNNLIVRVEAKLDKGTGLLTWRFTSLDPVTMLPTEDPTAGFLPPNMTAPEGEGQVLFTVQPKPGIATGTEIRNHARIVFDTNAPIDTPEWLNTIDNSKPTSRVMPLPATQCATGVSLQWSGSDEGSGVSDLTILVSDNNGPIVPLLSNTTATSTVFQGQVGHTYSFYSIARDNTQNFEEPHSSPDTTVTIVAVSPPAITAPPAITVGTGATATSCGVFINDATLGSAQAQSNCLGVIISRDGVPANHFFPVGNTVIKYTATDGAGNASSASQLVTVIDTTPPRMGNVTVDKPSLWPPNHKMVDVALRYDSVDYCGPTTCQVNITSNEPINGTGDGDSFPDWEVLDAHRVRLRAERSGKGKGRVYLIKVTCADGARNSTSRTAAVTVPSNGK